MKDISSDSPFVSKWRSQRLRSEQWTAFEKTLAEVRRALQTQPQLLPQFELLADELHDSFVNNRDSFRAEAFDQDLFLILQENLLTGGRVRDHLEETGLLLVRSRRMTEGQARQMDPEGFINEHTSLLALISNGHTTRLAASWVDVGTGRVVGKSFECRGSLREIPQRLLDGAPGFRLSFSRVIGLEGIGDAMYTPSSIPMQLQHILKQKSAAETCTLVAQFQSVQKHTQPPTTLPPGCCDVSLPFTVKDVFVEDRPSMSGTAYCVDFLSRQYTWHDATVLTLSDETIWSSIAVTLSRQMDEARECLAKLQIYIPKMTLILDETQVGKVCWRQSHNTCWHEAYVRLSDGTEAAVRPQQPIFVVKLMDKLLFLVPVLHLSKGKVIGGYIPHCSSDTYLYRDGKVLQVASILHLQRLMGLQEHQDPELQILLYDLATGATQEVPPNALLSERAAAAVNRTAQEMMLSHESLFSSN
jgi:hypothetical protein